VSCALALWCCACASETVELPSPPPVDWRSLDARPIAPAAPAPSVTAREREVARAYADALASDGTAKLSALLAEEAHFTFAGSHDALGRDRVVQEHDARLGPLDERTAMLGRVLLDKSSQVVEWTLGGVNRLTHKRVVLRGVTVLWTNDDGSIVDLHLYVDAASPKAQAPPAAAAAAPPLALLEQTGSRDEEHSVATVRASLDALENNDEAAYLATMTDDVEWVAAEALEPLRGKVVPRGYFRTMRKAVGGLDTQVDHTWAAGAFVAVEYRITGEQRGPLAAAAVRGNALLDLRVVDIAELHSGQISRLWRYENPAQLPLPPPGGAR
jgi:ketosteroid isomerase-like protein